MDQLISEKYIDDSRYASAYARDKSSIAGWGAVKIRYMLQAKGISQEDISSALADIDDDRASSKLYKLLETKARSLKNDPQKGLKLKRFALSRGYGYDEVSKMVDTILYNENDDSL
jgi:regulatory protein